MASSDRSGIDQLVKLEAARKLVLGDAVYYPPIISSILPLIGPQAPLESRRWGMEFLAEAFASPALAAIHKQSLSLVVLDTLETILNGPDEDTTVLKSVVQTSASIYPLVFRHVIKNAEDATTWAKMTSIKSKILKMWDTAAVGVRICCIKFVQRVIQSQTAAGVAGDTREPDQNEISLELVPSDHSLVPPVNLEAEASGLLDRLLGIFQDDISPVILLDATLNSLGVLIKMRASISNKIIYAILSFEPWKAKPPLGVKDRIVFRSLERTTRALLVNVNKQNPAGFMAPRIHQYLERLTMSRVDGVDEVPRKRAAPTEPTDGLDQSKRAKLKANPSLEIPPLPQGPISLAQLFTLTSDEGIASFDVQQLPAEVIVRLISPVLSAVNEGLLDQAVEGIGSRLASLPKRQQQQQPGPRPADGQSTIIDQDDDDDDYEPDFEPAEDVEQIVNKMDIEPVTTNPEPVQSIASFRLPQPSPLSDDELDRVTESTISRVFEKMNLLADSNVTPMKSKAGIHRLAATSFDKNAWITLIARLGTRASATLEEEEDYSPDESGDDDGGDLKREHGRDWGIKRRETTLGSRIRESLYVYILEDFRKRIGAAVSWVTEEWYNDRIQQRQYLNTTNTTTTTGSRPQQHYEKIVLRVLDGMLPYLDTRDKVFTRFVSELPAINQSILGRVKSLARDPERVSLAVNTLHYLILFRPPAREACLDAVEDLWRNYDDARISAAKLLIKWRPGMMEVEKREEMSSSLPLSSSSSSSSSEQREREPGQRQQVQEPELGLQEPGPGQRQQEQEPEPEPGQLQQEQEPEPEPGQRQQEQEPEPEPGQLQQEQEPEPEPGQRQQEQEPEPEPGQLQQEQEPEPEPGQRQQVQAQEPEPGPGQRQQVQELESGQALPQQERKKRQQVQEPELGQVQGQAQPEQVQESEPEQEREQSQHQEQEPKQSPMNEIPPSSSSSPDGEESKGERVEVVTTEGEVVETEVERVDEWGE